MPLMGSIYVGTSGLQTSQNALNTTAHNLSNMDTQGFVRQQVLQGDRVYNTIKSGSTASTSQQVGLGVTYEKVRQVRDYFLDKSYRKENGRAAFYETSYEALREVEDLLDELNDDASFNSAMNNMWATIEELAKTPDDTTVQRMLVQNAQSFLTNAKQVYQGLIDYQNELNYQIKQKVEKINELGHSINKLNDEIRKVEVGGIETANDLRDARNQALDELSGLVAISYDEDIYGSIRVKVEGVDFVATDSVFEMAVKADNQTGFYTPYWVVNALETDGPDSPDISKAAVFNLEAKISSESGTDIGSLRSMLYARGDKVANYTDIPLKPTVPDATDTTKYPLGASDTAYLADQKQYQKDYQEYEEKVAYYNSTIAQSVCMNIQAEFDQLIHNVVTTINKIFENAYKAGDGEYMSEDGHALQLFIKIETPGYDDNGDFIEEDLDSAFTETLYTISNIEINPTLIREAGKMKFKRADGTVDYETAAALVEAFDADLYVLNPNVTTKCSLNTYYTNLVSQVANSGSVYRNLSEGQQATVDSINYKREQVLGVSSDEELTSMIKFQNAYNAASRYINVIDEMLEHIINRLGG